MRHVSALCCLSEFTLFQHVMCGKESRGKQRSFVVSYLDSGNRIEPPADRELHKIFRTKFRPNLRGVLSGVSEVFKLRGHYGLRRELG